MAKKATKTSTPRYVTEERIAYEIKDTLLKAIWIGFVVGVISMLTYLIEGGLPALAQQYPEYAIYILAGSAFLVGVVDYLRHYKDTVLVEIDTKTGEEKIIC